MKLHNILILICLLLFVFGSGGITSGISNQLAFDLIVQREQLIETPAESSNLRNIQENWITQNLDHLDAANTETFDQYFLSNYEHFNVNTGGPIFIMVEGQSPIFYFYLTAGNMFDLAKEHGAAMFLLEFRFFGNSFPTNRTANLDTLQYLKAEQALYDLANFVEQVRYILPQFKDSEIVLFGNSIGGSIVTWYQKEYSNMIAGAIASSAPILGVADFQESAEVSGAVLRKYGGDCCYNRVRGAFIQLAQLFDTDQHSRIREEFNICSDSAIENQLGEWTLNELFVRQFTFLGYVPFLADLRDGCNLIIDGTDDLNGLAKFMKHFYFGRCIYLNYDVNKNNLRRDNWTDPNNLLDRLVLYQQCTEFGWYPSSTSLNQPYGSRFPIEHFYTLCKDVFGLSIDNIMNGINKTNQRFGGLTPIVRNIIFTHGMNDPLRSVGIQENINDSVTVILMHEAGRQNDITSSTINPNVVEARRLMAEIISGWLS